MTQAKTWNELNDVIDKTEAYIRRRSEEIMSALEKGLKGGPVKKELMVYNLESLVGRLYFSQSDIEKWMHGFWDKVKK